MFKLLGLKDIDCLHMQFISLAFNQNFEKGEYINLFYMYTDSEHSLLDFCHFLGKQEKQLSHDDRLVPSLSKSPVLSRDLNPNMS